MEVWRVGKIVTAAETKTAFPVARILVIAGTVAERRVDDAITRAGTITSHDGNSNHSGNEEDIKDNGQEGEE